MTRGSDLPELSGAVAEGTYAGKQLVRAPALIRWSHRRRFALALELCRDVGGKRVLDFGCGDGTMLALLQQSAAPPAESVGADISQTLVADCTRRLATPGLSFVHVSELNSDRHAGRYDVVLCTEVLEHVVDTEAVLDLLTGLLTKGGRLVVSVPVETGVALLVKQTARTLAGWAGIGDYPGTTPYTTAELVRAVFAGNRPHVERRVFSPDDEPFHDHKGFNWRVLRSQIERRLTLQRTLTSPVRWLPPGLNSQVWFIAKR